MKMRIEQLKREIAAWERAHAEDLAHLKGMQTELAALESQPLHGPPFTRPWSWRLERVSLCCGAPEVEERPGTCTRCREHTTFEAAP